MCDEQSYGKDYARAAPAKVWEIFDYLYGQRLAPSLKTEVSRLR